MLLNMFFLNIANIIGYDQLLHFSGSPFKINMRVDDLTVALPSMTKYFLVQDIQWCFLHSLGSLWPANQLTMYITGLHGYIHEHGCQIHGCHGYTN